jgi:hypothetical protein
MPNLVCPVCKRIVEYPRGEWKYVSKLPSAVCSVRCVRMWILSSRSADDYMLDAVGVQMGTPDQVFSHKLRKMFRSDYERRFAEWLKDQRIPYQYERWAFPVKGTTMWCPDFHLPDHKVFIEIKGKWAPGAHSKITDFQNRYPGIKMLVVPWTVSTGFHP